MMRQSSRNQRNKQLKTKHALQLFVLLAISIWLLYQLKHTFEKKHSVDDHAKINNPDENLINANDERVAEKPTKLGRKDLSSEKESEAADEEEEDEEKDTELELEQLLEDVEGRENGQEEGEENGEDDETVDGEYNNGEEDEEGSSDSTNEIEENGNLRRVVNASGSVQSDSQDSAVNVNQTATVNFSTNQGNNGTTKVGDLTVQDELHENEIIKSSVQVANETTSESDAAVSYLSTKVEGNKDEIKEG